MAKDEPIAVAMASKQREISVASFFEKNRHLLGFDNPRKSLLTTVREAVDNGLDACEEAGIVPEIQVEMIDLGNDRFKVIVEDNGPGIVKKQIPNIFAKLLYGSKFFKLSQSVTGDEPILVKKDGQIQLLPIQELVDPFVKEEGDFISSHLDIQVPAFDKNNKYAFRKVSHLIKHKRRNEIISLELETGRKVKVTGCHSLFTYNQKKGKVEQVEARKCTEGSYVIVPKRLPLKENKTEINILESIEESGKRWFVYGFSKDQMKSIFSKAARIYKKSTKSRAYYRFIADNGNTDVLEDSYKQNYLKKGYLPLTLVKELNIKVTDQNWLQTYFHGRTTKIPIVWPLTPSVARFLGFYVAEGHADTRQIGFTFSQDEKEFVKEIVATATELGLSTTIENRSEKKCIRVKCFGGVIASILPKWCGKGAKNKRVPEFILSASEEIRQHFLDALYQGDGHRSKVDNQLLLTTTSKQLANQVQYLWLLQGIIASYESRVSKGLGKNPSKLHRISIYGSDLNKSFVFSAKETQKKSKSLFPNKLFSFKKQTGNLNTKESFFTAAGMGFDKKAPLYSQLFELLENTQNLHELQEHISSINKHHINHLEKHGFIQQTENQILLTEKYQQFKQEMQKVMDFMGSDLALLKVKKTEVIDEGYEYVYDISVPGCENFVGGLGGISLHNTRGQQGIGISASVLYAQLTTGKPAKITSRISAKHDAHYYELHIDTHKNKPEIVKEDIVKWKKDHGTRIEMELQGSYQKGDQSVDQYIKQTAIVNPHVTIIYTNPKAEQFVFARASEEMPPKPTEIKPHPYGVEIGMLMTMLKITEARTLQSFLMSEFSRIGSGTAKQICQNGGLLPNTKPREMSREMIEKLLKGITDTKIIAPPTDCISPIGEELLEKGLKKEINAEFYAASTRPPAVYRGNPFILEVGVAYGGEQSGDKSAKVFRYANRVPLQYQQSACAMTKSVINTAWRNYGLSQSKGALPIGPVTIAVHMASVWVPFTSESKEAIAHYPEIIKEIKLALQDCGRKLASYVGKKKRMAHESKKRDYIQMFIPHVGQALQELLGFKDKDEKQVEELLREILQDTRGEMKEIKAENTEYDEEFAKIGKAEPEEVQQTLDADGQEDTDDNKEEDEEDTKKKKGKK